MNKQLFRQTILATLLSLLTLANSSAKEDIAKKTRGIKDWNFIVYIAANNNLHRFSIHNIRQMAQVGSTEHINILVQLDGLGQEEVTRYYIEKDNPKLISSHEPSNATTSGTVESLYNFAKWAIENYPAKQHAIVLWNHGSGIKDPSIWGRMIMTHRDELFHINYKTGLLELNRNIKHQKFSKNHWYLNKTNKKKKKRGIAFNDTHETYLTNQDLKKVLEDISENLLHGKKIDLLCMDACHMAMVEIGSQIKNSVQFMAASEEVEPGSGYNYQYLLFPFINGSMSPREFAIHTVQSYQQEYQSENADYTQSAINLNQYENIENNIKQMVESLLYLLNQNESRKIKKMLRNIRRNRRLTTNFCDPDYIDFCHFYHSLKIEAQRLLKEESPSKTLAKHLKTVQDLAEQGLSLMQHYIIKSASGENLPEAFGLSFYFPNRTIHKSYYKTVFDKATNWSTLLQKYMHTRNTKFTKNTSTQHISQ